MKGFEVVVVSMAMLSTIVALGQMGSIASSDDSKAEAIADAAGNLRVPNSYRATYEFLGSWAVAAEQGQGSRELHVVYASPGAIAAYRKGGHFPDGAVLVKEVFEAATAEMTTGNVSHAEKLKGWFVMFKDSIGTHVGNTLWGEGWGWSWFDATNPSKTTSIDYKANCRSCHAGESFGLDLRRWIPSAEAIKAAETGRWGSQSSRGAGLSAPAKRSAKTGDEFSRGEESSGRGSERRFQTNQATPGM